MKTNENIIEIKNVSKSFGEKCILNNVSMYVKRGEFLTLLGPSGCGKTTLLRILAGFGTADSGEILINGKDITGIPPHERPVNTVFQRYALFPHLDVYENIAFGLKLKKMPTDEIDKKVRKALKMVSMTDYEDRDVESLSGGQQQRVAIARAIVNEPSVLLLDEPLSALDLKMRKDMQMELKEMHRELGITFIYVTHDQEEALTLSDTIVVFDDGVIQQIGTPTDIYNEPQNAFVADFIGESNILNGTMIKDKLVEFAGHEFECVDEGFGENVPVDVVVRPEDIYIVGTYQEDYTSLTATTAAKTDLTYKGISNLLLDFGASYQFHEFSPEREFTNTSWRYDGSKNQTGKTESSYQNGHETALYGDAFLRMTDRFSAHAGLRYVLFGVKDKVRHRLEPRISARFDIGGNARIDLSYTEMNQFAHQVSTSYLDLPTEFWMPSTQRLAPMFSRQIAAEYSHRFPFGMDVKIGGWYKTMDNLTEQWNSYSYIPPVTNWDQSVITGKGRSYGLESEIEYTGKKLSLAAYYTLSWSERRFEELWYEWYPDKNDNRHKINLTASYRFSEKFDIYAGWNYHSGNRTTVFSYKDGRYGNIIYHFGSPNNMRLPDYHRLDVGLTFRKTTRKGNMSVWNLSVYNAYCRMNAMFAQMQIYTDTDRSVSYGIVPIIPSFSYTLKF